MTIKSTLTLFCCLTHLAMAQIPSDYQLKNDWLISPQEFQAKITTDSAAKRITFGNGLFSRTIDFRLGTTIDFQNLMNGESIIRAVEPEGSVSIDGQLFFLGGADGQSNKAFLTEAWISKLQAKKGSLKLTHFKIGEPRERLRWKRTRHHAPDAVWPPKASITNFHRSSPIARRLIHSSPPPPPASSSSPTRSKNSTPPKVGGKSTRPNNSPAPTLSTRVNPVKSTPSPTPPFTPSAHCHKAPDSLKPGSIPAPTTPPVGGPASAWSSGTGKS